MFLSILRVCILCSGLTEADASAVVVYINLVIVHMAVSHFSIVLRGFERGVPARDHQWCLSKLAVSKFDTFPTIHTHHPPAIYPSKTYSPASSSRKLMLPKATEAAKTTMTARKVIQSTIWYSAISLRVYITPVVAAQAPLPEHRC